MPTRLLACASLLLLAACAGRPPRLLTDPAGAAAAVRAVADDMEASFVEAARDTAVWPAVTDEFLARNEARNRAWLAQLDRVNPDALAGTPEWALHANLAERTRSQLAQRVCRGELWPLSTFGGWHLQVADGARLAAAANATDSTRRRQLERLRALPAAIDRQIARLEQGATLGYTAPVPVVDAVVAQVEALLPADPHQSPLDAPAAASADPAWAAAYRAAVRDQVYPAGQRFRRFLADSYRPRARPSGSLTGQRDGVACYRALVRGTAGRDLDPAALMADARHFLDSLRRELTPVALRLTGAADVNTAVRLLREAPRFTDSDRDRLLGRYRAAMERARQAMPRFFSRVTDRPVVVEAHGPAQERAGFPAQYSQAPPDGSRPARVFVNLARNELMTVGFGVAHEGFPGHHQERALHAELPRPHPVMRRMFNAGYTEGWGLYSEWLADTMGIYADELERVGYQIHLTDAALGIILDVGYHVFGWTREALVDSMMATSGRTRELANNYADRHAATPGQIATYHIGYRSITTARAAARAALGPQFDLQAFHDQVLNEGTVPLPALEARVAAWARQRAAR